MKPRHATILAAVATGGCGLSWVVPPPSETSGAGGGVSTTSGQGGGGAESASVGGANTSNGTTTSTTATTSGTGAGGSGGAGGGDPSSVCDPLGNCSKCKSCAAEGVCKALVDAYKSSSDCAQLGNCVNTCPALFDPSDPNYVGYVAVCQQACKDQHPTCGQQAQAADHCLVCTACPMSCNCSKM